MIRLLFPLLFALLLAAPAQAWAQTLGDRGSAATTGAAGTSMLSAVTAGTVGTAFI